MGALSEELSSSAAAEVAAYAAVAAVAAVAALSEDLLVAGVSEEGASSKIP